MGNYVAYTAEIALKICELIAEGKTMVDICASDDMPARKTVYEWLTRYPKFFDAYERAKELSAQSLEEEALLMARTLKNAHDFTGTKVQAYNIAMGQLRWSAARRDKNRYGQSTPSVSTTIPIVINTSLNLGQEGPPSETEQSIYTINVEVPTSQLQDEEEPPTIDGEYTSEGIEDEPANDDNAFGVPEKVAPSGLGKRNVGRPKGTNKGVIGKRKSARSAELTARTYAAAERKRLAKAMAKQSEGEK